jgi:7-cyano-7-deazaguanine synthase in queuosine biosynthesis
MPKAFKKEALDLLYISMAVYFADKRVLRENTYDGWTRSFKVYIPVLKIDKWKSQKEHLEHMISFLSGDNWSFEFRERKQNDLEKKVEQKIGSWYLEDKFSPDEFCMLSGGLDSFIGAIDLLSQNKKVAFVGIYGGGKGVKPYQDKINNLLQNEFSIPKEYFFNFNATPINGNEITTRTRSFLFFAHAIILASCVDKPTSLYIPENGLISLNIPLTNTRLGSSSTRTTHPYYLGMLQKLLNNMGIEISLKNPYQFKTKGEMLIECQKPQFIKEQYLKTMSCSHPDQVRYDKSSEPLHCGKCLPCSIRRASILKAYGIDDNNYADGSFEKPRAKQELRSFKIGILEFEKNKDNPLIIQLAGPIETDYEKFHKVYKRGMDELKDFINIIHD